MSGHLFVHLGPPKTGSTSLQVALQQLDLAGLAYLGTRQPREEVPRGHVHNLQEASVGRIASSDAAVGKALEAIADLVDSGTHAVISEELFLVWEPESSIWKKLERLDAMLGAIDRTYILTLRDPIAALPSYYQEMQPRLPTSQRLNPEKFFRHEACDCYDYQALSEWFSKVGQAVHWIEIEQLSGDMVPLTAVLGQKCSLSADLALGQANVGRKSGATGARAIEGVALADLAQKGAARGLANTLKRSAPGLHGALKRAAHSIKLQAAGDKVLELPKDVVDRFQRSYDAVKQGLRPRAAAPR